mgnify:CR=1 FL=1
MKLGNTKSMLERKFHLNRLRFPYEGRRNFKGRLTGVDGDEIILVVTDHEYLFPVEGIEKANVVPRF